VAGGDGGGDFGEFAELNRQVRGHQVDVVGQVFPGAGDAAYIGLAAELAFGAHVFGDACYFGGERGKLVHHGVDGDLQLEDFALHVDGDFFGQVAVGHGGGHGGDVTHLRGQVTRHRVHG